MSVEVGQIRNGYLIKEYLGEGSFGAVFKVLKQSTKEKFILKCMRLGVKGTEAFKKNQKTIQADVDVQIKLGKLCKFLVHLEEIFIEGEYCFLITEYCSNGDLEKILTKKNKLPQPEVFKLTENVLTALSKLHEEKITYRDLKPGNIFLTEDGVYKLDYSASRVLDQGGKAISSGYIAPEILQGESYSFASDVFSYGCILYRAITGTHPFANANGTINQARLIMGQFTDIVTNEYNNSNLIETCHHMLSVDPADRPIVGYMLENILEKEETIQNEEEEEKLEEENSVLKKEIEQLKEGNARLKEEVSTVKKKVILLEKELTETKEKNSSLEKELTRTKEKNASVEKELAEAKKEISLLRKKNEEIKVKDSKQEKHEKQEKEIKPSKEEVNENEKSPSSPDSVKKVITPNSSPSPAENKRRLTSSPSKKSVGSSSSFIFLSDGRERTDKTDLPITFIDHAGARKEGGMTIERDSLIFIKGASIINPHFTAFLDREVVEGIVRLEVVVNKPRPDKKDPILMIGIAAKDMVQKVSIGWFEDFNSTSCIVGSSRSLRICTGTTSNECVSHPSVLGALALELDMSEGTLRYFAAGVLIGCVTGVPKGVYFGMCNAFDPICYEVISLRRLALPTASNRIVASNKWIA